MSKELIERLRNFDPLYRDDEVKLIEDAAGLIEQMDRMLQLGRNCGGDLARIMLHQTERIAELERENAELREELREGRGPSVYLDEEQRQKLQREVNQIHRSRLDAIRAENEELHSRLIQE